MTRIDRFPIIRTVNVGADGVANVAGGKMLTGNITALNGSVGDTFDAINYQSVAIQLAGTFSATVSFEVSNDGTNWVTKTIVNSTAGAASTATSPSIFSGDIGARYFRVRASAFTSGTIQVTLEYSPESQYNVSQLPGTQSVQGTVSASMQPVTGTGSFTTTNLGAGATYTGTTVDRGTTTGNTDTRVKPMVRHLAGLVHGHLVLQESLDGTTWVETRRSPVPSDGNWHTFDWALHLRYWRLVFVNGATAQTGFGLYYQSSRGDGSSVDTRNVLSFVLSQTALTANATYTSATLDLGGNHDYSSVRSMIRADQPGVSGGFQLQFSDDGTNWFAPQDGILNADSGTGARTLSQETKSQARYVRLFYTNGTTAQTLFRAWLTLVSL